MDRFCVYYLLAENKSTSVALIYVPFIAISFITINKYPHIFDTFSHFDI